MQPGVPDTVISCPDLSGTKVFPEQNSRPHCTLEPQEGPAYQQWDKVTWIALNALFKTAHSQLQMCLGSRIKLATKVCVKWFCFGGKEEGGREKYTI